MKLIITEKDNAARRIAEILSDETATTERKNGVNVYRWGTNCVVGLSGHVVGLDFPSEYSNWRDAEPVELITADIVTEPTQENIVRTLEQLTDEASSAVIATDYDREGELIGKEAYELIESKIDGPIERVRFSSITETEVKNAFANPDDLDFDLAAAGEARQIIDLIWGAALTRFLSLSARQLGQDFISVGRVQSPTLKLIVDREREIQAFEPETYWELFTDLEQNGATFEAQYFYDDDGSEAERIWDESQAQTVHETVREATETTVRSVRERTRTDNPPDPFNTTAFIGAAGSLGFSASQAMSIAEELYTAGYVTYPRTDNTVYPEDLDPTELLESFVGTDEFDEDAQSLLQSDEIEPTAGDEETTDHPPIHPTGELPEWGDLSEDEWQVYELIVRRFFATVADPATWKHLRVVTTIDGHQFKANGKRLVEEGYHAVYPYSSANENYVPEVEEGETLTITDVTLTEKETQPPRRYGQSRLIKKMEGLGIGTKCLTADSRVLVRNKAGDITRQPIESLFEEDKVILADGDTDIATSEGSLNTISLNEERNRVTEQTQTSVSKRSLAAEEDVYRIRTDRGSFSVTEDHPLYVWKDGHISLTPATDVQAETQLVTTRRPSPKVVVDETTAVTWEEFVESCEKNSKLYGSGCNDVLVDRLAESGESLQAFADRLGAHRPAITRYESGDKDVPVWLLGKLDIRPDRMHGLNYETEIKNPFPLQWSKELARLLGSVLGDGSIHINEPDNVVDVRYHNTDLALVEQFVGDVETIFGVQPTVIPVDGTIDSFTRDRACFKSISDSVDRYSKRPDRNEHHRTKYQVHLSSITGRVLAHILEILEATGLEEMPEGVQPFFIGSLFDDEGHISRERKLFISNTDHKLLSIAQDMLANHRIDSTLKKTQHKLHVRGRRDLERFLNQIPITSDEKFYRGLDGLCEYDVTRRKATLLELIRERPKTTGELGDELDVTRGVIHRTIRELRADGVVEKHIEGSNRSKDGNRIIRYSAIDFDETIYATIRGLPSKTSIQSVEKREYDGPVYDLTIADESPNFAVEGSIIVHNSTRHHTIEKLYDRGYIEGDPPKPTKLAEAVVEAAEAFADLVVSEEMTAQLEADMSAIANGEATLDEVTDESRDMLERVFEDLHDSREEIGEHLQESLKADRRLGPCPQCDEQLLVRQSRRGSYFVGCEGFPECRFTLPLPSTGDPLVIDETCDEHEMHHVKMLAGRDTFVHGCPRCAKAEAKASEDRVIGSCPECGEKHDGELAIKKLQTGSRLVGCLRYPDCEYSLPLPRRGDIEVTDEYCDEHELPELVVHNGDEPWELGCPICNYEEYQAEQAIGDLEDIDGIGEKTAEKLREVGVRSPSDLSEVDADSIATEIQGVTAGKVRDWQSQIVS